MSGRARTIVEAVRAQWAPLSRRLQEQRVSLAAAGLAFFVALSIAPAAIALGSLAGLVLEPEQVRDALDSLAASSPALAPVQDLVDPVVAVAESASGRAFGVASLAGGLVAAFAASRVVLNARLALDSAFGREPGTSGLVQRIWAAVVTLAGILVAVAGIVALTVLPRLLGALGIDRAGWSSAPAVGWALVLVVSSLLAWAAMRFGPHGGTRVRLHAPGPLLAGAWVLAVTAGLGVYVQVSSSVSATLAVFGAPMAALLWLYLLLWGFLLAAHVQALSEGATQGATRGATRGAVTKP